MLWLMRRITRMRNKVMPKWERRGSLRGCPVQLVAILRRGEQCGQLRQAITDVERTLAATVRGHRTRGGYPRYAGAYAGMMLVFSSSMLAYITIIIMPRFRDIFRDYDTPLPAVTLALAKDRNSVLPELVHAGVDRADIGLLDEILS